MREGGGEEGREGGREEGRREGGREGRKREVGKVLGSVLKINPSLLKQNESHACSINLSSTVEIHGHMLDARVMPCSLSHAGSILRVCPLSPVCDSSLAAFLIPHTTIDLYNNFIN